MTKEIIKIGYFSLPKNTSKDFPRTYLVLNKEGKIHKGNINGPEIPRPYFDRALAIGDIILTKEGENFIRKNKVETKEE